MLITRLIQAIALSNQINIDKAMRVISSAGGGNFIAGTTMNVVRRSAYGRKAAHNATHEIREARNLGSTHGNFVT
jgi:structural maintenance of chromosomes protein 5